MEITFSNKGKTRNKVKYYYYREKGAKFTFKMDHSM
jgi:hypothetical protein